MCDSERVEELVVEAISNTNDKTIFDTGLSESVSLGDVTVTRATLEPDWGITEAEGDPSDIEYCRNTHHIVVLSGTLGLVLENGTRTTISAGSAAAIPPGHHGWTDGDEQLIYLEFERN